MTSSRTPVTASDISKRIDQIQFNATLNSELEALKLGKLMGATPEAQAVADRPHFRRRGIRRGSRMKARATSGPSSSNDCARAAAIAADLWLKNDMPQGAFRSAQDAAHSRIRAASLRAACALTSIEVQSYVRLTVIARRARMRLTPGGAEMTIGRVGWLTAAAALIALIFPGHGPVEREGRHPHLRHFRPGSAC